MSKLVQKFEYSRSSLEIGHSDSQTIILVFFTNSPKVLKPIRGTNFCDRTDDSFLLKTLLGRL